MTEYFKKPIADVTINYEDGTRDRLQYYSLVGFDGDAWYSILYSPPKTAAKIKMNNMLVDLSGSLLKSINAK
jgi:hypothetical protein